MDVISKQACKVANRVALGMRYGETSGRRSEAKQIVQTVLTATGELLDQIDPVTLKQWFEQFEVIYAKSSDELVDDPIAWAKFIGKQCDVLSLAGLHQNTILLVGDELARWDRAPVTFERFAESLDGMAGLVSEYASSLGDAIEGQAGRDAKRKRRTELFSNSVIGLAIALVAINEAIQIGDPRSFHCSAFASFGAALTIASVKPLYVQCDVPWR